MALTATQTAIKEEFEQFIKAELLKTWTEQGHNMNGKVVREMDIVVEQALDKLSFLFYSLPYGVYMESGVPSANIPFSGRSGHGGKSAYIQALIGYAMKRMNLDQERAKSAAFAIAYTHKKRGMPSPSSSRFSSTGDRTGWIGNTMERNEAYIRAFMFRMVYEVINVRFENMIMKYSTEFKTAI